MKLTLGVNICSVRAPLLLVLWRHNYYSNYAVPQCCGEYRVTAVVNTVITPHLRTVHLIQLILLVATELFPIPLVATRRNDD